MYGISEIRKQNNTAASKFEAEGSTHWADLPTGGLVINVVGSEGEKLVKVLDAAQAKKFRDDLGNHDGVKPLWQHRQAVCRKWAK